MATTDAANEAGRPAVRREGFGGLPCPRCGEAEACVRLDLSDLDACTCPECDGEFTLDDVRALLDKWGPVLRWIDGAPPTG